MRWCKPFQHSATNYRREVIIRVFTMYTCVLSLYYWEIGQGDNESKPAMHQAWSPGRVFYLPLYIFVLWKTHEKNAFFLFRWNELSATKSRLKLNILLYFFHVRSRTFSARFSLELFIHRIFSLFCPFSLFSAHILVFKPLHHTYAYGYTLTC